MAVGLGVCQVRSGTRDPCSVPAAVLLLGIPFCERHAREQQRYFEIGDLTGERRPVAYRDNEAVDARDFLPGGVLKRLRLIWRGERRA